MHVNVFTYPYISRIRIMAILQEYWDNTMLRTCGIRVSERGAWGSGDFRNGWPSTSRAEVNIERKKHVMSGDSQSSVRVNSQLNTKKDNLWKIIAKGYVQTEYLRKNGAKTAE